MSLTPLPSNPGQALMGAQRGGFVRSEPGTPHSEPFDESSARIFAESNRYSAISEPFDESSAQKDILPNLFRVHDHHLLR